MAKRLRPSSKGLYGTNSDVLKTLVAAIEQAAGPARLYDEDVAERLNLHPDLIPLLIEEKLLQPLGDPAPKAVRYYFREDIAILCQDRARLVKITNLVYRFNKFRNTKRKKVEIAVHPPLSPDSSNPIRYAA